MNVTKSAPTRHLYWETALDRLELDVIRAERMLDNVSVLELEPWDEPELEGPVPADLVDRALELRARQERTLTTLADQLGAIARQHAFAERVDRATGRTDQPVYLDVGA